MDRFHWAIASAAVSPQWAAWSYPKSRVLPPAPRRISRIRILHDPARHQHPLRTDAPGPKRNRAGLAGRQTGEGGFVSAITEAEILRGIALLPDGKRRAVLAAIADTLFAEDFADRRLPFDSPSAGLYAELAAHRARTGRPISVEDAQIAAIALCHALKLATRNTRDFADIAGLTVVNPWLDE